jgi:hypothetical protein
MVTDEIFAEEFHHYRQRKWLSTAASVKQVMHDCAFASP